MRLIALIMTMTITSAVADDLEQTLEGMFEVSGEGPFAAFDAQRAMGLSGGYLRLRTPVRGVNVLNFSPPRLNAGCSGIDLFAGSFSIVDKDQFEQLLRAIAANSVGYLFQLAISTMCNPCMTIMSELAEKVQEFNRHFRNTCQLAKNLMNDLGAADAVTAAAAEFGLTLNARRGGASDIGDAHAEASEDIRAALDDEENPFVGNFVWSALVQTNAGQSIEGFDDETRVRFAHRLIMTMTGTMVLDPHEGADYPNAPDTAPQGRPYPGRLDMTDLLDPSAAAVLYTCADGNYEARGCLEIAQEPFAQEQGVRALARRALLGGDGVIGLVQAVTDAQSPSPEALRLLEHTTIPVFRLLREVEASPRVVNLLAEVLIDPIANDMALSLGESLLSAARLAYTGPVTAAKPPRFDDRLVELNAQLTAMRLRNGTQTEQLRAALELVRLARPYLVDDPLNTPRSSDAREIGG